MIIARNVVRESNTVKRIRHGHVMLKTPKKLGRTLAYAQDAYSSSPPRPVGEY